MKNSKILCKLSFLNIAIFILWATINASASTIILKSNDNSGIQSQILYAGQHIDAGSVSVEVSNEDLIVTYETIGGWQLVETHLWVGENIADMPQTKKGNPKIGNFPYTSGNITGETSYSVSIPLEFLGFSCPGDDKTFYVAAHAALQKVDTSGNIIQTETGWADGDRFVNKGSWATFFSFILSCDDNGGGTGDLTCETAFAQGQSCFLNVDEDNDGKGDFNRWGWSIGPLAIGSYSFDIYAGAGKCDINKGTPVGTLYVDYDGFTADVTYTMKSGFTMEEVHLYVGSEILPRDVNNQFTVAPGQYPNINDELNNEINYNFTIKNLFNDIYVVAHAVVCGNY